MIKNKGYVYLWTLLLMMFCSTAQAGGEFYVTESINAKAHAEVVVSGSATQSATGMAVQASWVKIEPKKAETLTDGCMTLAEKQAENEKCLLCPLFKVILDTNQIMASRSFSQLSRSFQNVIVIVLALFIAYKTLLTVSALTKQDVGKYLGEVLTQAFKVLVAVLLLSNSSYVYNLVINPLMESGLEFGVTILDATTSTEGGETTSGKLKTAASHWEGGFEKGVISQNLLAKVVGTVEMFSHDSAKLPSMGATLMCVSTHAATPFKGLPDVSMFIIGLFSWAFGWAIALACGFYLLDSAVRFGIFCMLVPFIIACWPFKITMQYAKQGFQIFINAFFNFAMMGLVLSLTSELLFQALVGDSTIDVSVAKDANERATLEAINNASGYEQIEMVFNTNNVDALKDLMSLDGVKFLVLVACCIFAFKLVEQVSELAGSLSGTSGGTSIGGKIGGLAAQTGKRAFNASKNTLKHGVKSLRHVKKGDDGGDGSSGDNQGQNSAPQPASPDSGQNQGQNNQNQGV